MPGMSSSPVGDPDPKNLIVNYIPSPITNDRLRELFEPYGPVESARVIKDRTTQHPKGYGFVKYFSEESARLAMTSMNGFEIGHKRLRVTQANGPHAHNHLPCVSTRTAASSATSASQSAGVYGASYIMNDTTPPAATNALQHHSTPHKTPPYTGMEFVASPGGYVPLSTSANNTPLEGSPYGISKALKATGEPRCSFNLCVMGEGGAAPPQPSSPQPPVYSSPQASPYTFPPTVISRGAGSRLQPPTSMENTMSIAAAANTTSGHLTKAGNANYAYVQPVMLPVDSPARPIYYGNATPSPVNLATTDGTRTNLTPFSGQMLPVTVLPDGNLLIHPNALQQGLAANVSSVAITPAPLTMSTPMVETYFVNETGVGMGNR